MPVALRNSISDSESEDDELDLYQKHDKTRDAKPGLLPGERQQGPTATNRQSQLTNSTERLRKALDAAEQSLQESSPRHQQLGSLEPQSLSPLGKKRRHTSSAAGSKYISPERHTKRLKTSLAQGMQFDQNTSESNQLAASVRFTEHSVPGDSLGSGGAHDFAGQDDFAAHEPNLLFRDTGTTVPDNSSAVQELVERYTNRPHITSNSNVTQSSSIPWTASYSTQVTNGDMPAVATNGSGNLQDFAVDETNPVWTDHSTVSAEQDQNETNDEVLKDIMSRLGERIRPGSPRVVIPPSSPPRNRPSTRKGNCETTSEVNSEDAAIGLPRERYQPRPSKRRATAVTDEAIDYSVVPEKAAKLKRVKSASAAKPSAALPSNNIFDLEDSPKMGKQTNVRGPADADTDELIGDNITVSAQAQDVHSAVPENDVNVTEGCLGEVTDNARPKKDAIYPPNCHVPLSTEHLNTSSSVPDDKSSLRSANQSSSRKRTTRRSHTTIFEDHVDYQSSRVSPNLSQQQADRNSKTLRNIENDASPRVSKGQAVCVASEEDDEEDELALDNDAKPLAKRKTEEVQENKKRGRGRPSKNTGKLEAKDAERISEAETNSAEKKSCDNSPMATQKKKGRGRPPKNKAIFVNDEAYNMSDDHLQKGQRKQRKVLQVPNDDDGDEDEGEDVEEAAVKGPPQVWKRSSDGQTSISHESNIASTEAISREEKPASCPQTPAEGDAPKAFSTSLQKTPSESKASNSATPNSGLPKFRVGLSKRSRIPSLLKSVNPPTPKRQS